MSIAIRKTQDIKGGLEQLFSELNFKPGKKVYVKPNLSGRSPVLPGENTSVAVMDALIAVLQSFGSEVIIGHGALLGSFDQETDFEQTLTDSGFVKYRNQAGVQLINLDDLPRQAVESGEMTFHFPLEFFKNEIDTYINLAKIKTHMEATISFSLKNQMGLAASADRVMMHKTNLEKTIAAIAEHIKPDLSILEGFPAMENNGPHHGTARDLNLLAAGDDMVELDGLVAELLGFDSKKIKHLNYAAAAGVGKFFNQDDLKKYQDLLVNDFRQAEKVYHFGRKVYAYPTYACSRCIFAVDAAGREFKKHPLKYWRFIVRALFGRKNIYVVFGKADELDPGKPGKIICIGSCAKNFADRYGVKCLDKCPPGVEEVRNYLLNGLK